MKIPVVKSLFKKVTGCLLACLLKKTPAHVLCVNFVKVLRTSYLQSTSGRLPPDNEASTRTKTLYIKSGGYMNIATEAVVDTCSSKKLP